MAEQTPKDALNRSCMRIWRWTATALLYAGELSAGRTVSRYPRRAITLNYDATAQAERVFNAMATAAK